MDLLFSRTNGIGTALRDQAGRSEGAAAVELLRQAVAAYREVLKVYTRAQAAGPAPHYRRANWALRPSQGAEGLTKMPRRRGAKTGIGSRLAVSTILMPKRSSTFTGQAAAGSFLGPALCFPWVCGVEGPKDFAVRLSGCLQWLDVLI